MFFMKIMALGAAISAVVVGAYWITVLPNAWGIAIGAVSGTCVFVSATEAWHATPPSTPTAKGEA